MCVCVFVGWEGGMFFGFVEVLGCFLFYIFVVGVCCFLQKIVITLKILGRKSSLAS